MKKDEFINELSDYCNLTQSDIQLQTELKSINGFSSMTLLFLIAFCDEKFGSKLSFPQIDSLTDINSLIKLIGEDKFEA